MPHFYFGDFFMDYLNYTIKLARNGLGHVSPNPMVGAVLVKDDKIVGQGWHQKAGKDHAEIIALKQAGSKAVGATLYTNLEPCCHVGKTPPCTEAIINAGVRQVEVAMLDPNPRVYGKGKKNLEKAGIKVLVDQGNKAQELNEIFIKNIATGLPFITAKWAMTLDGKIAPSSGQRQWITTPAARQRGHWLRQEYDAILVGVNTIIKDDPQLTVRLENINPSHPIRIIIDSTGRTPLSSNIFKDSMPGKTIIATTEKMSLDTEQRYKILGAEVIRVSSVDNQVDLKTLFKLLAHRHVTSILIEGGNQILSSAFRNKLIDKVNIFIGPKVFGEAGALPPLDDSSSLKDWDIKQVEQIDNNILITAYPYN